MKVHHDTLTPAGHAVHFALANGWTISIRQSWGERSSVMAWPTGTNTATPAHRFANGDDHMEDVEDAAIPTLMAEIASLPVADPAWCMKAGHCPHRDGKDG